MPRHLGAAGAYQARHGNDLAGVQGEADVLSTTPPLRSPRPAGLLARRYPWPLRVGEIDIAPHHGLDQGVLIELVDAAAADQVAIPQHRDAIADPEDFIQVVRDVEQGNPLRFQRAMMVNNRSISELVKTAVGSSRINTLLFNESALAMATICW